MANALKPRYVGDDWLFSFTYQTGDTPPVAINLTGGAVGAEFSMGYSGAPVLELNLANSGTAITDAVNGKFSVTIAKEITATFGSPINVKNGNPKLRVWFRPNGGPQVTIAVVPITVSVTW
jgi:hypothetical protein